MGTEWNKKPLREEEMLQVGACKWLWLVTVAQKGENTVNATKHWLSEEKPSH